MEPELCLYGYYRSSATYRVRIALNLKGLDYTKHGVDLLDNQQHSPAYLEKNPQGLVPALDTPQGVIAQSLAIIEWLETQYPQPALLPGNPAQQALIRSTAYAIACDIHPLNNLRVQSYLDQELGQSKAAIMKWYYHWIDQGFVAIETTIEAAPFCFGDSPSLADVYLIPQVYNAYRFAMDLSRYPKIQQVYEHCLDLDAFKLASPEQQEDAAETNRV